MNAPNVVQKVSIFYLFFFNDTATTEIYTLSPHDALPISRLAFCSTRKTVTPAVRMVWMISKIRSEEHTSELQSHSDLVCRLLLEKKVGPRTARHALEFAGFGRSRRACHARRRKGPVRSFD